jgi:hypothetical protein
MRLVTFSLLVRTYGMKDVRMPNSSAMFALACIVALSTTSAATHRTPDSVAYPEGYRKWSHVHSALVGPGGGRPGLYHIYANDAAMRGYASGRFADGSMIAFDLFDVTVENNVTKQAARKLVDVMVKDSVRFADSGGWGFAEFIGDEHVRKEGVQAQCASCHVSRKDHDYVFSTYK